MRDDGRDDAGNDAGAERDANLARLGFGSAAERAEDDSIDTPFTKALNTLLDGYIDAEECCRRMVALG